MPTAKTEKTPKTDTWSRKINNLVVCFLYKCSLLCSIRERLSLPWSWIQRKTYQQNIQSKNLFLPTKLMLSNVDSRGRRAQAVPRIPTLPFSLLVSMIPKVLITPMVPMIPMVLIIPWFQRFPWFPRFPWFSRLQDSHGFHHGVLY